MLTIYLPRTAGDPDKASYDRLVATLRKLGMKPGLSVAYTDPLGGSQMFSTMEFNEEEVRRLESKIADR